MNLTIQNQLITIQSIQVYAARFLLDQPNKRAAHCRDCKKDLLPGLGIFRKMFRRSGYLCLGCFESHIRVATWARVSQNDFDAGFVLADPGLRACVYGPKAFSTAEILDAVRVAVLEVAETKADSLIGESVHPFTLGDVSEAMI